MERWWFRLLFVFYIIGIIVSPVVFVVAAAEWLTDPCSGIYLDNDSYMDCYRHAMDEARLYFYFGPIVTHYLIQLVLFKIVIDFIVLGGKK